MKHLFTLFSFSHEVFVFFLLVILSRLPSCDNCVAGFYFMVKNSEYLYVLNLFLTSEFCC